MFCFEYVMCKFYFWVITVYICWLSSSIRFPPVFLNSTTSSSACLFSWSIYSLTALWVKNVLDFYFLFVFERIVWLGNNCCWQSLLLSVSESCPLSSSGKVVSELRPCSSSLFLLPFRFFSSLYIFNVLWFHQNMSLLDLSLFILENNHRSNQV